MAVTDQIKKKIIKNANITVRNHTRKLSVYGLFTHQGVCTFKLAERVSQPWGTHSASRAAALLLMHRFGIRKGTISKNVFKGFE